MAVNYGFVSSISIQANGCRVLLRLFFGWFSLEINWSRQHRLYEFVNALGENNQ